MNIFPSFQVRLKTCKDPNSQSVSGCLKCPTVICARVDSGGKACGGGSGGPIVADRNNDGVWVQYGVAAFGMGASCGRQAFLGLYHSCCDSILLLCKKTGRQAAEKWYWEKENKRPAAAKL